MDITKPDVPPEKIVNVLIRIDAAMHRQLSELALKVGHGWGVATVMRQLVQNALDEGVTIKETGQHIEAISVKGNGPAARKARKARAAAANGST
jgi:hypothetical protein